MNETKPKDDRKEHTLAALKKCVVVAIIRATDGGNVMKAADALMKGGVRALEVTMNTPGALKYIRDLTLEKNESVMVGAGTVTTPAAAVQAIEAGARFLVTPFSRKEIIDVAKQYNTPILSGAFTPGEIVQAYDWGADVVKVFPAEMFGPAYLRALRAPLDYIPLMPTGGITKDNALEWLQAGAEMLGVGSALYNNKLVEDGRYGRLIENARAFIDQIQGVGSE
jgi:2-dehydro-3-deoxyphosphogluconate aldolase / (4S)-4-hydroxy-2-oxoglutarate aldolase